MMQAGDGPDTDISSDVAGEKRRDRGPPTLAEPRNSLFDVSGHPLPCSHQPSPARIGTTPSRRQPRYIVIHTIAHQWGRRGQTKASGGGGSHTRPAGQSGSERALPRYYSSTLPRGSRGPPSFTSGRRTRPSFLFFWLLSYCYRCCLLLPEMGGPTGDWYWARHESRRLDRMHTRATD